MQLLIVQEKTLFSVQKVNPGYRSKYVRHTTSNNFYAFPCDLPFPNTLVILVTKFNFENVLMEMYLCPLGFV